MIDPAGRGHSTSGTVVTHASRLLLHLPHPADVSESAPMAEVDARLTKLFQDHFDLVWRTVRRFGVPAEAIDDATQEVFVVASRKLDAIQPGKERAFLYGTAIRVASDTRRARDRRQRHTDDDQHDVVDTAPSPAELVDQKRARALLDDLIARLPDGLRAVFVLYELESLTTAEIADCLELPAGTVASRLRRAREQFAAAVARLEAARQGGRRG